MNEKITLPGLTQYFALQTGDSRKESEDFIREFFALVSDTLVEEGQVKIKDFGVFKTISVEARKSVNVSTGEDHEIPPHRKIVFVPSKEIAALVNEPFEMFETVEINDGVDLEDPEISVEPETPAETDFQKEQEPVAEEETTEERAAVEEAVMPASREVQETVEIAESDNEQVVVAETVSIDENPIAASNDEPEVNQVEEDSFEDSDNVYTVEDIDDEETCQPAAAEPEADEQPEIEEENAVEVEEPCDMHEREPRKRRRFLWGFLTGFSAAAVIGVILVVAMRYMGFVPQPASGDTGVMVSDTIAAAKTDVKEPIAEAQEMQGGTSETDSAGPEELSAASETVPTEPSDKKVYDTITKTRYLTTMAKDHYGNFNLWPYIYMENKAFLGHPDRIRPGTQVVIPPLSKYGVDPKNPADIAAAKKKGVEIYSRYK